MLNRPNYVFSFHSLITSKAILQCSNLPNKTAVYPREESSPVLNNGSKSIILLIEPKVRDCSFRLHTTLPFPTHLGPLDLYLDSHRSIANAYGSPLIVATTTEHQPQPAVYFGNSLEHINKALLPSPPLNGEEFLYD